MSFIEYITTEGLSTVKLGGYNKQEVEDLLNVIADEYEKVIKLLEAAKVYKAKAEQYDANYNEINDALVVAQTSKRTIVNEAKAEATSILEDAKNSANKLQLDASAQATALSQRAQKEAQETITNAKTVAKEIVEDAQNTAKEMLQVIDNERRQYSTTHNKLKSLVSDLNQHLNSDEWLIEPMKTKVAEMKQASDIRQNETKTEETKSRKIEQVDAPFNDLSDDQLAALNTLQHSAEVIQNAAVKHSIETPQQAQQLLDRMKSQIDS